MERSATAFTAADRIGQLAVQVNDIADTRAMLERPARRPLAAVTLWSGRVGAELAPEVWDVPARRTTPSCCRTTAGRRCSTRERLHAAGTARRRGARRGARGARAARVGRSRADDEDVHSRDRAPARRRSAARSTPAARATTRSRRRSGSTSPTRAPRRTRRSRAFALAMLDARRGRGGRRRCPATRTSSARSRSRSATTCSRGSRCSSATARGSRSRPAQAQPSPLGAGALAGSTLPLPPPPNPMRNSLDAVADRDFALDYLYAARGALHAPLADRRGARASGRRREFGFARLPEDAATGSSMMPQKLNPDVAELARGKAGTAIGRLTGLLATVKGLPLAYDRDLQEDKPPVFAARRDVARRARGADGARRRARVRPRAGSRGRGVRSAAARDRRRRGARRARACRSATRTSRSPRRCARARSSRRRAAPRLGDVAAAVAAAKERWAMT